MYLLFFLFFNFFLINKHSNISSYLKIYDLNSKNNISLYGGILLFLNIFIINIFFYYQIIPYEHFYKLNNLLIIFSLFLLGLIDDKFKIAASIRICFIIIFLYFLLKDESYLITYLNFSFREEFFYFNENSFFSISFTIFCILSLINALNFFDGINLQVIIYSIIAYLYLFFISYSNVLIIVILCLVFFSYLNFQNKSFLGDSGIYILSIIFSLTVIDLHNKNLIYADQICFLFLFPGLDMTRLCLERLYKRKNPFEGDFEHIHHLMKKKYFEKTPFIIIILSFVPIALYEVLNSKLSVLILSLGLYLSTIVFLKFYENK